MSKPDWRGDFILEHYEHVTISWLEGDRIGVRCKCDRLSIHCHISQRGKVESYIKAHLVGVEEE